MKVHQILYGGKEVRIPWNFMSCFTTCKEKCKRYPVTELIFENEQECKLDTSFVINNTEETAVEEKRDKEVSGV